MFGLQTKHAGIVERELRAWSPSGRYGNDEDFLNFRILPCFGRDITVHQDTRELQVGTVRWPPYTKGGFRVGQVVRPPPPRKLQKNMTKRTERMWRASRSWQGPDGPGSLGLRAEAAKKALGQAIAHVGAKRVVDAGCGSCSWQLAAIPDDVEYLGFDAREFDTWTKHCSVMDIVEDQLPQADLVIVRDVFIHMTNAEIIALIENVRRASRYMLATTNGNTTQFVPNGTCRSVRTSDYLDDAVKIAEYENYFDIGNPKPRVIHHHQLWDLRPGSDG
jgi:hypothetical protein